MMCIVIIAQYADCTPCGFGVHPRAAILHFEKHKWKVMPSSTGRF